MKKGFTLIEVIAVIALLGIIIAIVYPLMDGVMNKNTTKLYNNQIKNIEYNAENYFQANAFSYDLSKDFAICVSIDDLYKGGYITSNDLKDPRDNSTLTGKIKIEYNSGTGKATYNYDTNCSV